jgi:hypothetical protein
MPNNPQTITSIQILNKAIEINQLLTEQKLLRSPFSAPNSAGDISPDFAAPRHVTPRNLCYTTLHVKTRLTPTTV